MKRMSIIKRFALWGMVLALWAAGGSPASALANPGAGSSAAESPYLGGAEADAPALAAQSHTVTLGQRTIGEGELLSYTTVSPQFAGSTLPEGYYAGNLTVQLTGQIVIASGGELSIGTLSVGGQEEASPVIQGDLSAEGLIVVKSGGRLKLTDVALDVFGQGLLIVQEPGASVTLTLTEIDQDLVQWAPPGVNNAHDAIDDLWLPEGTLLTEAALPQTLTTMLQYQGTEEQKEIPLHWDLENYAGQTSGELTLSGQFVGEDGTPLASVLPLALTVHWYPQETIVVTDVRWSGEAVCSALFTVQELPEDAEVWGEISADGGETWSRWPEFEIIQDSEGADVCGFYAVDAEPQYYRLAAEDSWAHRYWVSEEFLLPEEDSDDQGGNRGGSTTPIAPEREPVLQEELPEPSAAPDEGNDLPLSSETDDTPETGQMTQSQTAQSQDDGPSSQMTPEEQPGLPLPAQVLLVAAGVAVCAGVAAAAAGVGPFRRKRK